MVGCGGDGAHPLEEVDGCAFIAETQAWTCRKGVNLSNLDLSNADLTGPDMFTANLANANLGRADLSGANLGRVNLSGADLSNADLTGADLSNAYLGDALLTGVAGWDTVTGQITISGLDSATGVPTD